MSARGALALTASLVTLAALAGCSSGSPSGPDPSAPWQYQLTGTLDLSANAKVFDVDGEGTTKKQVDALHGKGAYVICYMSAGTYEDWRSDARSIPTSVRGQPLEDWPGERWLDIRRRDVLLPIMEKRIAACKDKGFDAVEFDNVDGYANRSGFPLTDGQQLAYNRALAEAAHDAGMAAALKNDADQAARLVGDFDFAIVEECVRYDECARYKPFRDADKAVLAVEYEGDVAKVCATLRSHRFSGIVKDLDLGPRLRRC